MSARDLRIVALILLLAYAAVALATAWWVMQGQAGLLERNDDPGPALPVATVTSAPADTS